jgi:tetratricopeptide (TPR) repeat protein/predicted Ser/Thr protein kinase
LKNFPLKRFCEALAVLSHNMSTHPIKIGKYNVEDILGRGGMGVVYKALDVQIGRYVAIKMITGLGDENLIERFKVEAKTMGSLHCPNIVTVYNVGEHEGNPYLVMQFLEGPSLDSMIREAFSLTLPERLGIIIDVCNGLDYAHQRGVIHRDIKPGNIIVLRDGISDGTAVIVDFGIARLAGDTGLTKPNHVIGSIHYMSVEQLQDKAVDNRTDIYSLGVVLFQLLTGVLPFNASETAATFFKILNDPPPSLSAFLKEYPAELDAVISRVLAKKREERYGTAKDLAFDLVRIQEKVKAENTSQLIRDAETWVRQEDWRQAKEKLQQVLRIDRQNNRAQQLMNVVQERIRLLEEVERARVLRNQANEAYLGQRYDDALRLLDQAVTLDAKNGELVSFRDSVRAAKERATSLRRALRRADAAFHDGDLDEAQAALDDARRIDPENSQVNALQILVSRHTEERICSSNLRKLFDQAEHQIATRDLAGAFATLKTAEGLDPASDELKALAKKAVAASEQESRRTGVQEFRRQIEAALLQEDFSKAVAKAQEGLRRFPGEQELIRLEGQADAQRIKKEQKKFVQEQFAAASALAESGQVAQAVAVLRRSLEYAPGNTELQALHTTLRDRLAAEESERRKLSAIDSIVAEGRRALRERGARNAREFLDKHASQYADSPKLQELYASIQAQEDLGALDARLASESNPVKRVLLDEESIRSSPDNPGMRQRLGTLRDERDQIRKAIDHARGLEEIGRFSDAIKEWQKLRKSFPRIAEFALEIKRLESLGREAKKSSAASPVKIPPAESHSDNYPNLLATKLIDASPLENGGIVPVKPDATKTASLRTAAQTNIPGRHLINTGARLWAELAPQSKYLAIAVAVVLVAATYYLIPRHKHATAGLSKPGVQVHIITTPSDAEVAVDSRPIPNGVISLPTGTTVKVDVTRLGYKKKSVEIRREPDGNISLEPEALHLSIQTSEKTGIVELDGKKIAELTDGALDQDEFVPDGEVHELRVSAEGKKLFDVEFQCTAGSLPQVKTFDTNRLLLITSLGGSARLYAGSRLKNVQMGSQDIAASPAGADLTLSEQNSEVAFGEGSDRQSVPIENSNAPALAIYSAIAGGQVQITANVLGATLTVNGARVKSQRRGWLVRRLPGTYTFKLSAEGYESNTWTMTLLRGQTVSKQVDLTQLQRSTLATLVVTGGTPESDIDLDGKHIAKLNGSGNLQLPNVLAEGSHSLVFAKPNFQKHEVSIKVDAKQTEVRLAEEVRLTPWPRLAFQPPDANVTVTYKRVGTSQAFQSMASEKLTLSPGEYELQAESPGFQKFSAKQPITLTAGEDVTFPLKLVAIADYEFQDPAQVIHDGPEWVKSKDPHSFVHLRAGFLHENLVFAKPGKNLFRNKKVEWQIETVDGSAHVDYVLEGSKLTRKLVVGDSISDVNDAKVDVATAAIKSSALSVHIQVDGFHVLISNDNGLSIDDFVAVDHNFSGGRISLKTDSQFLVRNK